MKSLARPSFFRLFELLVSRGNPGAKKSEWSYDGVAFERERHSFTGPRYGFAVEVHTLTASGRQRWALMVTKEHWWLGNESTVLRSVRWAKPLRGQRADIMTWLREKERQFDNELGDLSHLDEIDEESEEA
jgi:hypothetical protein